MLGCKKVTRRLDRRVTSLCFYKVWDADAFCYSDGLMDIALSETWPVLS